MKLQFSGEQWCLSQKGSRKVDDIWKLKTLYVTMTSTKRRRPPTRPRNRSEVFNGSYLEDDVDSTSIDHRQNHMADQDEEVRRNNCPAKERSKWNANIVMTTWQDLFTISPIMAVPASTLIARGVDGQCLVFSPKFGIDVKEEGRILTLALS